MADNSTFITGVAAGAFDELPAWATQKTSEDILQILQNTYKLQAKTLVAMSANKGGGKGMSAADIKEIDDQLGKLGSTLNTTNAEEAKRQKERKKREEEEKKAWVESKKLTSTSQKLDYTFGLMTAIGGKVFTAGKAYVDVYDNLYKSGLNLLSGNNETADGLKALNSMVIQSGMRLETLQKVMEKYSSSLNAVGVARYTKSLVSAIPKLDAIGFRSEEAADLMATMIESEIGYSDVRKKSSETIASDTIKLGQNVNKLSMTFGISRQNLLDNIKVISKSTDASVIAATRGVEFAKNVSTIAAAFQKNAPMVAEGLMSTAASLSPEYSPLFKTLNSVGSGADAARFARWVNVAGQGDPAATAAAFKDFQENLTEASFAAVQAQAASGNAEAKAAMDFIAQVKYAGRNFSSATEAQENAAVNTEASIARVMTQVERSMAAPQAAIQITIQDLDKLSKTMTVVNDALYKGITGVSDDFRNMATKVLLFAGALGLTAIAFGKLITAMSLFQSTLDNKTGRRGGKGGKGGKGTKGGKGGKGGTGGKPIASGKIGVPRAGVVGLVAGPALDFVGGQLEEAGHTKSAAAADIAASAATMAGTMALLGSVVPVLGTAAGMVAGGLIGGAYGIYQNWDKLSASSKSDVPKSSAVPAAPKPSMVPNQRSNETIGDDGGTISESASANPAATAMASFEEKTKINSSIEEQKAILAQLLNTANRTLSVNEDILRFTKRGA